MEGIWQVSDARSIDPSESVAGRYEYDSESDHISFLGRDHLGNRPETSEKGRIQAINGSEVPRSWKTPLVAIGCYSLAFLISISHYTFFRVLDGKDSSATFMLHQSQVTTISLLLVTAFRASILTVLGLCFTQQLWNLLRERAIQVSMIESLFQIRSNVFELANPKLARRAPVLLVAAILSWLIALATIYPPGALTVRSEQIYFLSIVNASIMNPPSPEKDGTPWPNTLADILGGVNYHYQGSARGTIGLAKSSYISPTIALRSVAKLSMFTGQIMPLERLGNENSSHSLVFEGPRVACQSLSPVNTTIVSTYDMGDVEVLHNATWQRNYPQISQKAFVLSTSNAIGYYPAPKRVNETCHPSGSCSWSSSLSLNDTVTMVIERHVLECNAFKTNYTVRFNYTRGSQEMTYDFEGNEPLLFNETHNYVWNATEKTGVPNTTEYKDWSAGVPGWRYQANSRAILDAVGLNLDYVWRNELSPQDDAMGTHRLENGSEVAIAPIRTMTGLTTHNNYTILEDSILLIDRFTQNVSASYRFDPRISLDMNEKSLNELLANVTISALSLNTWYGNVSVNNTEYRNVYRFQQPLNLILSYGLCLVGTLVFVIIGLNALRLNGVPATDGGFLQILMTTTGDTALNRAAAKGSLGATDAAPKELLTMKVRFANLNGGTATGAGFGTIEETTALERKGWRTNN